MHNQDRFYRHEYRNAVGFFVLAAIVYAIQYGRCLWIRPNYDDWGCLETLHRAIDGFSFHQAIWNWFTIPLGVVWRPLHILPFWLDHGDSMVWTQVYKIAAVIVLAGLFVWTARALGLKRRSSFLAGAAFLFHQSLVLGGEPDLWGDVICSIAVVLAIAFCCRIESGHLSPTKYIIGMSVITLIACLGKEAGVVLPLIPLTFFITGIGRTPRTVTRTHAWSVAATFFAVALYLILRLKIVGLGLTTTEANPQWEFIWGVNIFRNAGLLVAALLVPVSSIQIFLHGGWYLALAIVYILFFLVMAALGIRFALQSGKGRILVLLLILFVVVQGPALLFDHTNERNFTRSLPVGLMLLGLLMEQVWIQTAKAWHRAFALLFLSWILFSQAATAEKATGIIEMHKRGTHFLDQVQALMPTPPNRVIIFAVEDAAEGYSEYVQPFHVHMYGTCDLGLSFRYQDPTFRSDFYRVKSVDAIPDSLPRPDFWVDVEGNVVDLRGIGKLDG